MTNIKLQNGLLFTIFLIPDPETVRKESQIPVWRTQLWTSGHAAKGTGQEEITT